MSCLPAKISTGLEARLAACENTILSTSGIAPGYLQANLIVLPSRFAADFRLLCFRNPVPCPLLAESASVGNHSYLKSWMKDIADDKVAHCIDIRTDAPRYMVYRDGKLLKAKCKDLTEEWTEDHVAFLIGCSYSFETALAAAGLLPNHTVWGRVVPMYRTNLPLCPAGVFTGSTYTVSMRLYKKSDVEKVRGITRPYVATHGEPIAWGWEAVRVLGVSNINRPDWGETPFTAEGKALEIGDKENVPVFWGCGVTPQEAVMRASLPGVVMGHAPGHMIVLDVKENQVIEHT
ncbi:uncharacterized protein K452DRAFT_292612 [Aplosporella prunicola CBS 121167]|uniref:DUF1445 domain-containing protein n=1 Tax=Aplosporella prunicola CBS 121167 TaxID=1176127 RepID=A0A6A6AVX6_9PEZI|nr:uncharacterized protein K452DRAFT_292612 [Aplosporella prunicola CBS 121167]KAF2136162.1 hypothetical protein K452DRAFT_292612 [Aplosporella prunicola CBS 121167]